MICIRPSVVLAGVLESKRQSLMFLWKRRTFVLHKDLTFRRYNGVELRHTAKVTASTTVAKVGSTEFTVTFHPSPSYSHVHYHLRARSSTERDMWAHGLEKLVTCLKLLEVFSAETENKHGHVMKAIEAANRAVGLDEDGHMAKAVEEYLIAIDYL